MNTIKRSANEVSFYKYGARIAVATPERGGWVLVDFDGEAVGQGELLPNLAACENVVLSPVFQAYVDSAQNLGLLESACEGHESLAGAHMGESVFCNGTCQ